MSKRQRPYRRYRRGRRQVCVMHGKAIFTHGADAHKARARHPKLRLCSYFDPECGWWHLSTRMPERGQP